MSREPLTFFSFQFLLAVTIFIVIVFTQEQHFQRPELGVMKISKSVPDNDEL